MRARYLKGLAWELKMKSIHMKSAATMLAVFVLSGCPGYAQSSAQLAQKALGADQGGAGPDVTIPLYRQVLGAAPDQRVYAAFAQYRIAQLSLEKGALATAAAELARLAREYGDYKDLVGTLVAEDRVDVFHGAPSQDAVQKSIIPLVDASGHYRNDHVGLELDTQGWVPQAVVPSTGGGEILRLVDKTSSAVVMVWMRADRLEAADIAGRLNGALQQKIIERLSYPNYRVRTDSIQRTTIGGKQALSAVCDYTQKDLPMAEILTFIYAENGRALVFARVPASQFAAFKPRVDGLASTVVLTGTGGSR